MTGGGVSRLCEPNAGVPSAFGSENRAILVLVTLLVCWLSLALRCGADEVGVAPGAETAQTLRMSDLPEPPAELRAFLTRGKVTFLIGGERPSVTDPGRSTGAKLGDFDAESQFRLSYSFQSRSEWRWANRSGARRLNITMRFERLKLDVRHRVWLKEMPPRDSFWDSPLVRHEIDHVRLSSDPRLTAIFVKAIDQHERLELTREESVPLISLATRRMSSGGRGRSFLGHLTGDDAQPLLDAVVKQEFDQIVELIEIRYRELDRQTQHGRDPIPEESPLREWLEP